MNAPPAATPRAPVRRAADLTHDAVNEALLPFIPKTARRILDLGCGTGTFGARLKAERDGSCEVVGVTLSPREADQARRRIDAVYILDMNLPGSDLPDGRFDAVVCSHTLGYFVRAEAILADLRGRLSPSGVLLVAVPNVVHWRQRVAFLRGRFEYADYGVLHCGAVRFFDRAGAYACVRDAGYEIIASRTDGYLPLPAVRRLAPGFARWADKFASDVLPGLFGTQFLIVARPMPGAPGRTPR